MCFELRLYVKNSLKYHKIEKNNKINTVHQVFLQRTVYKCIIVDITLWGVVFFSYIVILLFVKENKIMHIWVLCEHSMDENAYNNINNNVFISVFFQSFP